MRQLFIATFLLFSVGSYAQPVQWIPFNWEGDSVSGKYFDKLAITIPVTLENLPNKFKMQFDLGAIETVIYGNSIKPYLVTYSELQNKIDTTIKFRIQSQTNYKFRNLGLKLGNVSFGRRNIGHFANFGDDVFIDSIHTKNAQNIGTLAPDLFEDKILIIDYPGKKIGVASKMPKRYSGVQFRNYKMKDGRIKIPITINGKDEDVMFDTGSSLFALITTSEKANEIATSVISDSLKVSSWGEYHTVYGKQVHSEITYGKKVLNRGLVYFDNRKISNDFYNEEKIWGITGNAYFLKNIVIIDYKNKRFGIN